MPAEILNWALLNLQGMAVPTVKYSPVCNTWPINMDLLVARLKWTAAQAEVRLS